MRTSATESILQGFNGVEIHGAHGFLLDQFMKGQVNDRTDKYGGSLENRCRFPLEVVKAFTDEVGGDDRVGTRLSPFSNYCECEDSNPQELGLYMVNSLNKYGTLYCHMVDLRMKTMGEKDESDPHSLVPMRKAFNGTLLSPEAMIEKMATTRWWRTRRISVAYGRLFLANPDLPKRFDLHALVNKYNKKHFTILTLW